MKTRLAALCAVLSLAACDGDDAATKEIAENGPKGTLDAKYQIGGLTVIEWTPATAPEKTCIGYLNVYSAPFCFDKK